MSRGGYFSVDSLRGVWILVVNGDPDGRQALAEILAYCGALVSSTARADEALRVMRQVKPDLLVVALADDPDVDFIRQVRALKPEDGGVIPAIAIGSLEREEPARGRGFQVYVRTPLDPWELCRLVSGLMTVR